VKIGTYPADLQSTIILTVIIDDVIMVGEGQEELVDVLGVESGNTELRGQGGL